MTQFYKIFFYTKKKISKVSDNFKEKQISFIVFGYLFDHRVEKNSRCYAKVIFVLVKFVSKVFSYTRSNEDLLDEFNINTQKRD